MTALSPFAAKVVGELKFATRGRACCCAGAFVPRGAFSRTPAMTHLYQETSVRSLYTDRKFGAKGVGGRDPEQHDALHRQPVVLHDGGAAVRVLRPRGRGEADHHGPRPPREDAVRLLLRRVLLAARHRGRDALPQRAQARRAHRALRLGRRLRRGAAVRPRPLGRPGARRVPRRLRRGARRLGQGAGRAAARRLPAPAGRQGEPPALVRRAVPRPRRRPRARRGGYGRRRRRRRLAAAAARGGGGDDGEQSAKRTRTEEPEQKTRASARSATTTTTIRL